MLDSNTRREELADFLKSRREKVQPVDVGITPSPRRRALGLLREEVAQLAGISATWYTWMEQARPTNPSLAVLTRLGNALRLDSAERVHLINLARPDLALATLARSTQELPAPLLATLRGLSPYPVYVTDLYWNVMAWNEPATQLFGDFDALSPDTRNILDLLFLNADWRKLFVDWDEIAKGAIAQYRAQTAQLHDDQFCRARVARLLKASREFALWWPRQDVRAPATWRKTINHPNLGRIVYDYATLQADVGDGRVQFVIYTPAEAAAQGAGLIVPLPGW
ncbi:helix-turn-helix transcriptional regulator [Microvirga sp. 2YAF29]|uniref:helix-turn-helix transcriptional regulator n=1 Tax=Microvirga sp. 2YAF29 TaxID=3233031 RepID=UPI003F9BB3DF